MLRYIIHCKEFSWHCTIPPRYGKYDLRKAKTRDTLTSIASSKNYPNGNNIMNQS